MAELKDVTSNLKEDTQEGCVEKKTASEWESADEKRKRLPTSWPAGGLITPV